VRQRRGVVGATAGPRQNRRRGRNHHDTDYRQADNAGYRDPHHDASGRRNDDTDHDRDDSVGTTDGGQPRPMRSGS
jgi:hypothetical protein